MTDQDRTSEIRRSKIRHAGTYRRMALRPEATAVLSCIVALVFFSAVAHGNGFFSAVGFQNITETTATIAVLAIPAALLLVAGEFDLTIGAMVGLSQFTITYPLVKLGWPLWVCLIFALAVALFFGLVNSFLIVRLGLSSLIVTLAGFFWIAGLAQGLGLIAVKTTIIDILDTDDIANVWGKLFNGMMGDVPSHLWWFVAAIVIGSWVLHATRFGNWIYAAGGDADAALRSGVNVARTKTVLYVISALSTVPAAALILFTINEANVNPRNDLVFQVVAAAFIGGAALTGGFGSPLGAGAGALLFGVVSMGFYFTNIPSIWYQTFVGAALIVAVIINTYARRTALRPPRGEQDEGV